MKTSDDLFRLELFIAKFLRYGVIVAGLLIFVGWLSQIDFHGDTFANYHVYRTAPLIPELKSLWSQSEYGLLITYAGLMALISLPLLRVAMTGAVFIKQKDYLLASIVALVLAGLMLSIALGFEI